MSSINHEVAVADQNVNHVADPSRPVHTPRPTGGVHSPTTCGPSSEGHKEEDNPKTFRVGPLDGLGDEGSLGGL
jgi:hypothetical protein